MASNQKEMSEWLRLQAERLQNTIVNVQSGMSVNPALYFGTRRSTYSDVISIITTTQSVKKTGAQLSPIKQPKKQPAPLNEPLFVSPFSGKAIKVSQNEYLRRNQALLMENHKFMSKLNEKRAERKLIEHAASNIIQRLWRGYSLRSNFSKLKKRLKMRKKVRSGMHQVTKGTSVILEEKERKKRANQKQTRSASVIQRRYRVILATRVRQKEQTMLFQETQNRKATEIQCLYRRIIASCAVTKARQRWYDEKVALGAIVAQRLARGHLARRRIRQKRLVLQTIAVFMIQSRYRIYLARKALVLEKERDKETRWNAAALDIQRCYRGKIGRRRVYSIRNVERQRIQQAAALGIQRVARGIIGRRMAQEQKRRYLFERRLHAVHRIQSLVRGFVGRRRYARFATEEKANIFTQTRLGHMEQVDDIFSGFVSDKPHSTTDVDHRGNTVLLIACRWGHKRIVRKCLRWGMEIDHTNQAGESGVELAIRNGYAEIAEYLISKKAQVNFYGRTLLHDAARRGMTSTISLLLGIGVGINERDETQQYTALHEAALSQSITSVRVLLENKAKVDAQSSEGLTPLHLAAGAGSTEIATTLLDHGADISVLDSKNRTAWRHALSHGHEACAAELRRKWCQITGEEVDAIQNDTLGADECKQAIAAAKRGDVGAVEDYFERGFPLDYADPLSGNTLLMEASAAGKIEIVKLCCKWGVKLEQTNFYNQTALFLAAAHQEAAMVLVEAGANILHRDGRQRTPIHEAAAKGYTFTDRISSLGISLELPDTNGRTPLHEAATTGSEKLCRQMINLGASVTVKDKENQTPLQLCCKRNNGVQCAQFLLNAGASAQETDASKRTALHYAARCGNEEVVAILLKHNASSNATDDSGRTPGHDAVDEDSLACLRVLLDNGCDPLRKDHDDCTLLMDALSLCNNDCVDLLLQVDFDMNGVQKSTQDTLLHLAAKAGNLYGVKKVLEHVSNPQEMVTRVNKEGHNAVYLAVYHGRYQLLPLFVEVGVDFLQEGAAEGTTLLHIAATSPEPSEDLMNELVGMSFSVVQYDKSGYQPLHLAVKSEGSQNGNQTGVAALIMNGAPVNSTTRKEGMTALHCAAEIGNKEACKVLLEHGADPTITYSPSAAASLTARQVAEKNNHFETVDLF